jgi:3-isopropylmalate/(R)-2-methylmalate dehydratase large subunit
MAEKILARAAGRTDARAGDFVTARPDVLMCHEALGLCLLKMREIGVLRICDPDRVVVVLDHYFPAPTVRMAAAHTQIRTACEMLGIRKFLGHAGICHQVLTERGLVWPGALVLGTDSHSCTYGGVGAAGTGIGISEMTYVLATGELWMLVPQTVRFDLRGTPGPALMSKDVMLHIAGTFGTDSAQYKSVEFSGPLARAMSVASRMTMANMGVEIGAKFAFFPADDVTLGYLQERAAEPVAACASDPEATYEATHVIDVSPLEPQVACPHSPGNAAPVSAVAGRPIHQAFLGSCANARLEDLAVAAAVMRGHRVDPRVRMIVTPASHDVAVQATKAGYTAALMEAGAHVTASGCGACPGGHGGVVGPGEVCISSSNRNFRGRMGSPDAEVYLASPATVAASAIAGTIADPRDFLTQPLIA